MTRTSLTLIALLALAACGKPAEQQPTAPVAPATEATLPADAPAAAPAWTASVDGVGPIKATTAFSRDAIAALFPDSEVKAAFLSEEGAQVPIVTVYGPSELAIQVKQGAAEGRIGAILAQGGPVVGPRGETLMAPFSGLGFKAGDCVIGADRFSGAALCRRPGAESLAYVIGARGELKGNPGDAPDAAELAAKGFLREFLWQAPTP
ncbi:MAG: DUF1131 family protein [Caulobacteraceae bacterium]|nr:MAG: DUF1131 family protein [Caulobacteraceae bacterium]